MIFEVTITIKCFLASTPLLPMVLRSINHLRTENVYSGQRGTLFSPLADRFRDRGYWNLPLLIFSINHQLMILCAHYDHWCLSYDWIDIVEFLHNLQLHTELILFWVLWTFRFRFLCWPVWVRNLLGGRVKHRQGSALDRTHHGKTPYRLGWNAQESRPPSSKD